MQGVWAARRIGGVKLEWSKIIFACALSLFCSPLLFFVVFGLIYSVNRREFSGALGDPTTLVVAYIFTLALSGYAFGYGVSGQREHLYGAISCSLTLILGVLALLAARQLWPGVFQP